jgi:hypothetical protein
MLRIDDPIHRWTMTIGLSIALDAIIAEVLLYTHKYTAVRVVFLLAVVACAGAVITRLSVGGEPDPAEPAVAPIEMSGS